MNRGIFLCCVALLVVLAGCSGGSDGDSAGTTTIAPDGQQPTDTTGGEQTTADGGSGGGAGVPELAMLQFDRDERYVYDVVYVDGVEGRTYIDVSVEGEQATINVTSVIGDQQRRLEDVYTVPTNDPDAVVDAMEDDIRRGGIGLLLQSQDVTNTFVTNDIAWAVGATYSDVFGNVTVTGESTVGGVDCLTYDVVVDGQLFEQGCLTPDLESPVSWEKYLNDDDLQLSWTLVSYEQG